MSRSGYSDDYEYGMLWEQAVDRATFGRRGQALFRRLRAALDAMPVKRLIAGEIVNQAGEVCALGAIDPIARLDPEDREAVARHFKIAPALAADIVFWNDEEGPTNETPEDRWMRMRAYVDRQIGPEDLEA